MKRFRLLLSTMLLLTGFSSMLADIVHFDGTAENTWTATADDGCDNGSTIVFNGMVVTIGAPDDGVTWTWNPSNQGLIPSQMPSYDGTVESLITSFSDTEPYGELPTHGAFLKIEPTSAGNITIMGKASSNSAQSLVFVKCHKADPNIILAAQVTPWDNAVTEWTYEVDDQHTYYFFQLAYPGKLTAYRFTLRGVAYEKTGEGSGDDPTAIKVGYLYNGELGADLGYKFLSENRQNNVTAIEANKSFTTDDFADFDAIVISSTITNDEAIASLKEVRPFVPMLNLNPQIYGKWGYGQTVEAGIEFATVRYPNHALFKDLELIPDPDAEEPTFVLPVCSSQPFTGLQLDGVFADDPVLAVAYQNEEVVAIHTHNFNHNGFIYIPYTQDALADATSPAILNNAVMLLAAMKSPVTPAPAPTFSLEYDYQSTIVTIMDAAPRAEIFYTLDGSDPTEESIPYTGPFTVSEELTVRAVARGDGYLLSEPSEKFVDIQLVCPLPVFSMDTNDGQTTVTISSDIEGAKIYYNYKGAYSANQSTLYTQPIVLTSPRTIYAYQICEGYLNSKLASAEVIVANPHVRIDVLSHMDANQEQYFPLTSHDSQSVSLGYYFPWTNTKPCPNNSSDTVVDFDNGWSLRSRGQHVAWEGINATLNYGDATAFNPVTVEDENSYLPVSSGLLNLSDWNPSAQPSARIQTTQPLAGPFDVVAYIVNQNGNIGFGDSSLSEWTATAADGCDMGSTITLDGVVITLGSPNDTGASWTWHAGNGGLLPSQMPSTEGTVETLVTTFSEEAPFGDLPQHGAFLKIEPTKAGNITISGKASANAAQPLVFVTCDKNAPSTILSAIISPWNNNETQWTYEVDAEHVYYFFQLSYPEKLTAYRFTLRGIAFESTSGPDTVPGGFADGEGEGTLAPKVVIEVATSDADGAEWTQLGEALISPTTYRLYNMHLRSYEGTAPVFVRARIEGSVARAGVLDIYITYEGEESKQILQQQTEGIAEVQSVASLPAGIYSLSGVRQDTLHRGMNIIVSTDGKIKKMLVR